MVSTEWKVYAITLCVDWPGETVSCVFWCNTDLVFVLQWIRLYCVKFYIILPILRDRKYIVYTKYKNLTSPSRLITGDTSKATESRTSDLIKPRLGTAGDEVKHAVLSHTGVRAGRSLWWQTKTDSRHLVLILEGHWIWSHSPRSWQTWLWASRVLFAQVLTMFFGICDEKKERWESCFLSSCCKNLSSQERGSLAFMLYPLTAFILVTFLISVTK